MTISEMQGQIVMPGRDAPAEAPRTDDYDMNLCLVVPFGLQGEIFTWGLACMQSYVAAHEPGIRTSIVDLRGDDFTRDLKQRYGPDMARLLESLKFDQPIIFGQTAEAALGVVAGLGDRFIAVARDGGLFKSRLAAHRVTNRYSSVINRLAGEVHDYFLSKIRDQLERNAGRPTVWGLSVYDGTIVPALQFARAIRKLDPESPIIMGGGYFNACFAERFMEGIDPQLVNGVVVGRGEDAICQLARAVKSGVPLEQIRIAGFHSNGGPAVQEAPTPGKIAIFVPAQDEDSSDWMPVNPAVKDGIIRVIPQVGCSWGRCTFCDHIDKDQPTFSVLPDDFLANLTESIATVSAAPRSDGATSAGQPPIVVQFDGDEIDPELLSRTIKHVAATNQSPRKVKLKSWLQVKKFTEELGHTLFECKDKIEADLICNAESFNYDALRAMKKGHTPLQAVFAVKAMIDTGHVTKTNVFWYYPLEGLRGVAEEIELASRTRHLLCSPSSDVDLRAYAANEIDEVFHDQQRFLMKIRRRNGDVWLKHAFGVDLPLQHMSAVSQENRPFGVEGIVVGCYARAIESVNIPLRRHKLLRRLDPARGRLRQFLRRLELREVLYAARAFGHIVVFYLVTRLIGRDYWRRGRLWFHINDRAEFSRKSRLGAASQRNDAPSYFFLRGRILTKNYQGWGRKENWQYQLNHDEYAVLRYLYKVRKRRALFDRFRESIGDSEMEEILRRQVELGSVVESHGSFICVVNDPEYWEYEPGHWD